MEELQPKRTSIRDDALNLPNLLTMLRIALIPGVLWLLWDGTPTANFWAAILYIGTALTDLIDGYLARIAWQKCKKPPDEKAIMGYLCHAL